MTHGNARTNPRKLEIECDARFQECHSVTPIVMLIWGFPCRRVLPGDHLSPSFLAPLGIPPRSGSDAVGRGQKCATIDRRPIVLRMGSLPPHSDFPPSWCSEPSPRVTDQMVSGCRRPRPQVVASHPAGGRMAAFGARQATIRHVTFQAEQECAGETMPFAVPRMMVTSRGREYPVRAGYPSSDSDAASAITLEIA